MGDLKPFLALYRQHWLRLSAGALLAFVTLVGSIGLLSLSGWFIAATAVAGLVITKSADFNYMLPAGGVRFFSFSRTAARWGERVVTHDATFHLLATLRTWFFQALAPLSASQLKDLRDAELLNRMVADIDALDHLYLRVVTPVVAGTLAILALMGFLAFFDGSLALILGSCLLLLLVLFPVVFYRLGIAPGKVLSQRTSALRLHLADYLEAQTEFAVFGANKRQRAQLHQQETALFAGQRRMAQLTGLSQALITTLNGWLLLLMLLLGWQQMGDATPPGPLLALLVFATLASFEAIAPLANAFQHLSHTLSAASRLKPILELPPQVQYGQLSTPQTFNNLSVQGLSFQYDGALAPTLKQLDLTINAGEKVAILGRTGCGKSTLLDLLTRQLSGQHGQISLNDQPIEQYSHHALSQSVCHISQRVHIFNDTLGDNLRLAKPDATEAELIAALNLVELDYLIGENGLTQWLGEGGRKLSGGEQRRLGLARALLHPAPLLLLDEPTEGLDQGTEARILANLIRHRADRTLLYITHRQAALEQMDRVLVMEQGQLQAR